VNNASLFKTCLPKKVMRGTATVLAQGSTKNPYERAEQPTHHV